MKSNSSRGIVAIAGAVVVLIVIFFLVSRDDALGPSSDEVARAVPEPRGQTASLQPTPSAPVPSAREGDEEPAPRIGMATSLDAGEPVDGGSLNEFLTAVGKQAIAQFLADNAAAAEKHVDRFCSETKDLVGRKEIADPPRKRDAAGYMAGRADWEGGKFGLLHLPASITQRMGNPPNAWRSAGPELYAGLDFTWMTELLQFDHWSLYGAGPLRDEKPVNFFESNLPNYISMQQWAKLRLLKGVHEGNLAQASIEVRHLAGLIGSSGTLVGEMIRLSIANIERKTWEDLGQPVPEALPSADEAFRLRQSAFAGMYFLYPGVPRAVKEKALKCIPMRCASLTEAIGGAATFREFVPGMQQEIDWLQSQSPCDPQLASQVANSPPPSDEVLRSSFGNGMGVLASMQQLTDGGI